MLILGLKQIAIWRIFISVSILDIRIICFKGNNVCVCVFKTAMQTCLQSTCYCACAWFVINAHLRHNHSTTLTWFNVLNFIKHHSYLTCSLWLISHTYQKEYLNSTKIYGKVNIQTPFSTTKWKKAVWLCKTTSHIH